jgi:hypothetical protein
MTVGVMMIATATVFWVLLFQGKNSLPNRGQFLSKVSFTTQICSYSYVGGSLLTRILVYPEREQEIFAQKD